MEKKIIVGVIALLGLIVAFLVIKALITGRVTEPPPVYILSTKAYDVITSGGIMNLSAGTKLGGDPVQYAFLRENREFNTTAGRRFIFNGTKIDCYSIDPGEPNPCDPYTE